MNRCQIAAASAALGLGALIVAAPAASAHPHCVTHAQFRQVERGQTVAKVRREIGSPESAFQEGPQYVRVYNGCTAPHLWVGFSRHRVADKDYAGGRTQ